MQQKTLDFKINLFVILVLQNWGQLWWVSYVIIVGRQQKTRAMPGWLHPISIVPVFQINSCRYVQQFVFSSAVWNKFISVKLTVNTFWKLKWKHIHTQYWNLVIIQSQVFGEINKKRCQTRFSVFFFFSNAQSTLNFYNPERRKCF